MIILATAIILSLNGSGIIGKTNETKQKSNIANAKNVVELARAKWELNKNIRTTYSNSFKAYAEDKLEKTGFSIIGNGGINLSETGAVNVIYVDKNKDQAIIPEGFSISTVSSEQIIEDGLVIIDAKGNEFVWIPVEYEEKGDGDHDGHDDGFENVFKRSTINSKYTEPSSYKDENGNIYQYPNEVKKFEKMYASAEKNKGFYIARYEAGDGDAKGARKKVTIAHEVVSKKGVYVYNYVPLGESMTNIEPFTKDSVENVAGIVYLSQNMYKSSNSVVSTLCYGVQWDAVMNFVNDKNYDVDNDSSAWGNYTNYNDSVVEESKKVDKAGEQVFTAGYSEYWKVKNIYDLAGNVWEWTMEAYDTVRRVARGGSSNISGYQYPASYRNIITPPIANAYCGFRPTLYIK